MTSMFSPVAALSAPLFPLAEVVQSSDRIGLLFSQLLAVVIFAAVGIVVLAISFWIMGKLSPFSLVKEMEEDQNTALGIVLGSIAIGISIIIAAAIIG